MSEAVGRSEGRGQVAKGSAKHLLLPQPSLVPATRLESHGSSEEQMNRLAGDKLESLGGKLLPPSDLAHDTQA